MKIADFASPYSPLFSSLVFFSSSSSSRLLSFPGFISFVCCPASHFKKREKNM
jgi:hypothetical protein